MGIPAEGNSHLIRHIWMNYRFDLRYRLDRLVSEDYVFRPDGIGILWLLDISVARLVFGRTDYSYFQNTLPIMDLMYEVDRKLELRNLIFLSLVSSYRVFFEIRIFNRTSLPTVGK